MSASDRGSSDTRQHDAAPEAPESEASLEAAFAEGIGRLGPVVLAAMEALEQTFRRLHPPDLPRLRAALAPLHADLVAALDAFESVPRPAAVASLGADLRDAAGLARAALEALVDPGSREQAVMRAMRSMHDYARAQAGLYPLRLALPPISKWFAEPHRHDDLASLEAVEGGDAEVGLFRSGEAEARGGFDLYVPESYDGSEAWPLLVALHGGSGNGADFLFSWLREARSRRCLLLAPTSQGSTWSFGAPDVDGESLRRMTEWVSTRWRVDPERILLTGLSDGATMTLLVGLGPDVPYTHLAPISGVLHPMNFANGNLDRARGRPIQLVHGALDWMFPVGLAQEAARVLEDAGAALVYREIANLSHTYPREENARIIEWLDPRRGPTGASAPSSSSAEPA